MKASIRHLAGDVLVQVYVSPSDPEGAVWAVMHSTGDWSEYCAPGADWDVVELPDGASVMSHRLTGPFADSVVVGWAQRLGADIARCAEQQRRNAARSAARVLGERTAPVHPVYPVHFQLDGAAVDGAAALALAMRGPDTAHSMGRFSLGGCAFRVTDPVYTDAVDSAAVTVLAAPGTWHASALLGHAASFGDVRVKQLRVRHDSAPAEVFDHLDGFAIEPRAVEVDSGQCGFFDEKRYPAGERADDAFYSRCCELSGNPQLPGGGVLPDRCGVVAVSGHREHGGFALKTLRNTGGQVIAAVLIFVEDAGNRASPLLEVHDAVDDEGEVPAAVLVRGLAGMR